MGESRQRIVLGSGERGVQEGTWARVDADCWSAEKLSAPPARCALCHYKRLSRAHTIF